MNFLVPTILFAYKISWVWKVSAKAKNYKRSPKHQFCTWAHSSIYSFLIFFLHKPLIVGNYSLLYSISSKGLLTWILHLCLKKKQFGFSLPLNSLKRKRWLVLPRENLQKKISCNFQLVVEVGAFLLLFLRGEEG